MCRLKIFKNKFSAVIIFGLLCVIAVLSVFGNIFAARVCFSDAEEVEPESQTRIVGYLPDWTYQAYRDIDFSTLTHINISFCNMRGGEIACGIPDNDLKDLVAKAHANNVKIMAALGGGGNNDYGNLISSASKRESLNEKIVAFCEKYNLDGIDLDIEIASGDGIWNDYGPWVSALRSICDSRGWLLSTATAQWVAGSVTYETFSLFDYVNVMAYDNDSRGSTSHSSYEFAVECLNYFNGIKKVPKEKLVLGVPFYGRGYDDSGALDWNSYKSFSDLVKEDSANFEADNYMGVAYTGALTMREKCALAKEYGGVMIWEISMDADGEYSLLSLIKNELFPVITPPANGSNSAESDGKGKKSALWIGISVGGVAVVASAVAVSVVLVKKRKARNKN